MGFHNDALFKTVTLCKEKVCSKVLIEWLGSTCSCEVLAYLNLLLLHKRQSVRCEKYYTVARYRIKAIRHRVQKRLGGSRVGCGR